MGPSSHHGDETSSRSGPYSISLGEVSYLKDCDLRFSKKKRCGFHFMVNAAYLTGSVFSIRGSATCAKSGAF